MKKNILFLFAFIFIGCVTVDLTERSNIIDLPGQSKQQIYQKSVQWTTHEFASGRATIDYKNQEVGKINANGLIFLDTVAGSSRSVYMVIAIDCAAGKARINVIPKGCHLTTLQGGAIEGPCDNFSMNLMSSALNFIPGKINDSIEDYKNYMIGGKAPAWDGR